MSISGRQFELVKSECHSGLTPYGAGMHYDPLISSRAKSLVSWGRDRVVLCLIIVHPFRAPTKVFALPVAFRLYKNRQGLTKGKETAKKGKKSQRKPPRPTPDPNHRTRPELALELIRSVAGWSPEDELIITGDGAHGGKGLLSDPPPNVHLISHVHPKGALHETAPPRKEKTRGPAREKGDRLPAMPHWAGDPNQPWAGLKFDRFGFHATAKVKTIEALYYKAGRDRLLTIVLVRDLEGERPDQMFYCTERDWTARQILSAYACRRAIECTFENSEQFLGLEGPANRLPKAVERTAAMAMIVSSSVVIWFHRSGHPSLRFPLRPWYPKRKEPSFADMLTTLRRVSYEEKDEKRLPKQSGLRTWVAQLTELLSRAG